MAAVDDGDRQPLEALHGPDVVVDVAPFQLVEERPVALGPAPRVTIATSPSADPALPRHG